MGRGAAEHRGIAQGHPIRAVDDAAGDARGIAAELPGGNDVPCHEQGAADGDRTVRGIHVQAGAGNAGMEPGRTQQIRIGIDRQRLGGDAPRRRRDLERGQSVGVLADTGALGGGAAVHRGVAQRYALLAVDDGAADGRQIAAELSFGSDIARDGQRAADGDRAVRGIHIEKATGHAGMHPRRAQEIRLAIDRQRFGDDIPGRRRDLERG